MWPRVGWIFRIFKLLSILTCRRKLGNMFTGKIIVVYFFETFYFWTFFLSLFLNFFPRFFIFVFLYFLLNFFPTLFYIFCTFLELFELFFLHFFRSLFCSYTLFGLFYIWALFRIFINFLVTFLGRFIFKRVLFLWTFFFAFKKCLRIGRTGRKGHKGLSISFIERGRDENHAANLTKMLRDADQAVPEWLGSLAGDRPNDFDRGQDDIRNNQNYRQSGADYKPRKSYFWYFELFWDFELFEILNFLRFWTFWKFELFEILNFLWFWTFWDFELFEILNFSEILNFLRFLTFWYFGLFWDF